MEKLIFTALMLFQTIFSYAEQSPNKQKGVEEANWFKPPSWALKSHSQAEAFMESETGCKSYPEIAILKYLQIDMKGRVFESKIAICGTKKTRLDKDTDGAIAFLEFRLTLSEWIVLENASLHADDIQLCSNPGNKDLIKLIETEKYAFRPCASKNVSTFSKEEIRKHEYVFNKTRSDLREIRKHYTIKGTKIIKE
ncbi:MAG: hypothetical protein ACD_67C00059G0003 [uncultured bacterium]|nr:MAG: hypothetical protein ACD_67C00059G0003 [uncultured bacterium]